MSLMSHYGFKLATTSSEAGRKHSLIFRLLANIDYGKFSIDGENS